MNIWRKRRYGCDDAGRSDFTPRPWRDTRLPIEIQQLSLPANISRPNTADCHDKRKTDDGSAEWSVGVEYVSDINRAKRHLSASLHSLYVSRRLLSTTRNGSILSSSAEQARCQDTDLFGCRFVCDAQFLHGTAPAERTAVYSVHSRATPTTTTFAGTSHAF